MEGKSVILSVLIMSLLMVQNQVEGGKICCPSLACRITWIGCDGYLVPRSLCLSVSGCLEVPSDGPCPATYQDGILENSGNDVKRFCKLGCMSSVCGAMTTLQNSGKANSDAASEVVNETVDRCAKTCATFCNKDSLKLAAETA